jgi:hypothetical protein
MQKLGKVQTQTTWAKASDTINKNSDKIYEAVTQVENATIRNKGYFLSSSELKEAYPNPIAGMTAFVHNQDNDQAYPYDIYQSYYDEETGVWIWRDTSNDAPFPDVDIDSINNAIQGIQDEIEDLQYMRETIDRLDTDKADKSALEATNNEVSKKQNKLDNYKEAPGNDSVEIFAQGSVSMRNDSQGGVSFVKVYGEDTEEGLITPVARMSAENENGDYASVTVWGNEVHIDGDVVNVNGFDLMQTIEDVATLNGTGDGSVTKKVTDEIAKVVANAPSDLDTLKEIADYIKSLEKRIANLEARLTNTAEEQ